MNAAITEYEDQAMDFKVEFRRREATPHKSSSSRGPSYRRSRGKAPQQFNGIHRRRRNRIKW